MFFQEDMNKHRSINKAITTIFAKNYLYFLYRQFGNVYLTYFTDDLVT